jgi:diguanylate cyclase
VRRLRPLHRPDRVLGRGLGRWLCGVSTGRVEPTVPLFLGVHGLASGWFSSSSPLVLSLFALVVVSGVAGLLGWRSRAAATARALTVLGVALAVQLIEPDLVSSMLQWYYCVAALYALLLAGPASVLMGPAAATCYLVQWAAGVGPAPAEVAVLRAGVLVAFGWTMHVAGRAYRTERDTARLGRDAAEAAAWELARVANHDALTGLPNRRGFLARLTAELTAAGSAEPDTGRTDCGSARLQLIVVHVDRFAFVNDTFGQKAGDLLLCDIAERLRDAPGTVTGARLSGAEFAFLTHADRPAGEGAPGQSPMSLVDAVLNLLRAPYQVNGQDHQVVLSAGVARPAEADGGADNLLRAASLALQHARRDDNHHVAVYRHAMAAATAQRVTLEQQLRRAIRVGDIRVAYQPIVDLRTGTLHGVEALARWTGPNGPVPPDVFIPLAEELGLIPDLGMWVLDLALDAMSRWRDQGLAVPLVAVNASPLQLHGPDFTATVRTKLVDRQLRPDQLALEITEGAVILAPPAVLATLTSMRDLGVRISLDDFGTGHSSLARLRDLPVTELKIDRSFVAELTRDSTLTRLVLSLAESLGLHTVAEGVETAEQLELLRQLGADAAQGYHLARPMPDHQLAACRYALPPREGAAASGR